MGEGWEKASSDVKAAVKYIEKWQESGGTKTDPKLDVVKDIVSQILVKERKRNLRSRVFAEASPQGIPQMERAGCPALWFPHELSPNSSAIFLS